MKWKFFHEATNFFLLSLASLSRPFWFSFDSKVYLFHFPVANRAKSVFLSHLFSFPFSASEIVPGASFVYIFYLRILWSFSHDDKNFSSESNGGREKRMAKKGKFSHSRKIKWPIQSIHLKSLTTWIIEKSRQIFILEVCSNIWRRENCPWVWGFMKTF